MPVTVSAIHPGTRYLLAAGAADEQAGFRLWRMDQSDKEILGEIYDVKRFSSRTVSAVVVDRPGRMLRTEGALGAPH